MQKQISVESSDPLRERKFGNVKRCDFLLDTPLGCFKKRIRGVSRVLWGKGLLQGCIRSP